MLREGHREQTVGLVGVYRYERATVYVEGIGESYPSEGGRSSKGYSVGKGTNVGLRDLRVIVVQKRDMCKEGVVRATTGKREEKAPWGTNMGENSFFGHSNGLIQP